MKLTAAISISIIAILTFLHFTRAQTTPTTDPINDRLNQAKSDHEDAMYNAQKALQDAFDAQIKLASDMGNPDGAKALQIQDGDFTASQKMLSAPVMKDAVKNYQDAVKAALDQAKDQHAQAITAARQDWADAIDARINTVAATGNLQAVKDLQAAKAVVLSDGMLPEDVDDPDAMAGQKKIR